VNQVNMQEIVKQRYPAKHHENPTQPARGFSAVKQSEQNERRPRA
jgi:hypothetical protein